MTVIATAGATVSRVVRRARERLAAAGVAAPDLDARILVGHALGLDRAEMIAEGRRQVSDTSLRHVDLLIARRIDGEPVGRILGRREFWGLEFRLGAATLEPRPDTETLVQAVLDAVDRGPGRGARLRIADLGTGTGCLLVALLSELCDATGIGVDISAEAIAVARANADALGVGPRAAFVVGSWIEPLDGDFDVIVANPPYIRTEDRADLDREVAGYDPAVALDGGFDGLDAYRAILLDVERLLPATGVLALEVGAGQLAQVAELAAGAGLEIGAVARDLGGIERVLVAGRKSGEWPRHQKTLGMQGRTG